jgi:ADP-heptose:LPS heptosyltransferase
LRLIQTLLFRANQSPQRILIFRTGSFGDGICAIPAIHSIRSHFSNAQLDILTNTGHENQNLVSIDQLIAPGILDRVINYQGSSRSALIAEIRQHKYDLVIQLPQYNAPWYRLFRDMVVFRILCGIPAGFGWQWDATPVFRRAQEALLLAPNERRRLLDLLVKNRVPALSEFEFPLRYEENDRQVAESTLSAGLHSNKVLIGIVPGAKRSQNRWPVTAFQAVCKHFSDRFEIVLLGGPDDRDIADKICQDQAGVHSLCGQLLPMQNAWILKKCALVLSNDTGLMHLAYAVHAPLVAVFSARDLPGRWYPPNRDTICVLRRFDTPCSVCLSETCADNICMKNISVLAVIAAMEDVLAIAAQPNGSS